MTTEQHTASPASSTMIYDRRRGMRRALGGTFLLALLMIVPTVVLAQDGERGPRGPHGARMIEHADADGDGALSYDEFVTHATERFAAMDGDGDGVVTEDELIAGRPEPRGDRPERDAERSERRGERGARGPRGPHGPRMLDRADTDGDGALSYDEFVTQATERFDRMDGDGDGVVTAEELADARPPRGERGHGPRGECEGAEG